MKPFVLEEALAGAKVITGSEKLVTDIAYFPSSSSVYKVCAVIDGDILYFTVDGHFRNKKHYVTRDLFMAPDISEGWINIYKGGRTGKFIHKTEKEARDNPSALSSSSDLIACIRIEWEN
jgi:hypothetical protein